MIKVYCRINSNNATYEGKTGYIMSIVPEVTGDALSTSTTFKIIVWMESENILHIFDWNEVDPL